MGSGTAIAFSDEKIDDIMKIVKHLEDACFLIKGVSETVKNEVKKQNVGLLGMLAATLDANLLGNLLAR